MQPKQLPLMQLEPLPGDLMQEARRIWLERPWFQQRYRRLEDLLADPERRRVVLTCARMAWLARMARLQTTNT